TALLPERENYRPSGSGLFLKRILSAELHYPRIAWHSAGALDCAGDTAEVRCVANVQAGRAEVHVVEEIEELGAELHLMALGEAEVLGRRRIHLLEPG